MFLYLIGLLAALAVLVPTEFVESYIKWPLCFVAILLITFYFNKKKRDDAYITREVDKISHRRGLFHPIMIFTALSYYVLAFYLIMEVLLHNGEAVIIDGFDVLLDSISTEKMIIALSLLVVAFFIYLGKWMLSKRASESSLRGRAFLYVVLTTCIIALQFVALELCHTDIFWEFVKHESNIYVYFGLAGFFVLLDLIFTFVGHRKRKKAKKLAAKQENLEVVPAETKEEKEFNKTNQKQRKIIEAEASKDDEQSVLEDAALSKKELKRQKKYAKACAKEEKRLAKEEAKLNKKIAKEEAKLAKKAAKKAKKAAKKEQPVVEDGKPEVVEEQPTQE